MSRTRRCGSMSHVAPRLANLDHAVIDAGIAGAGPQAAMRAMQGRGDTIVATASAAGIKPEAGVAAYGASKAALIHLVKVAAKEAAPSGIRVNAIAPAGVETPV